MRRDWTECQKPPPSWNKDAYDFDLDSESILTSIVRRCYLNYLKRTLEENIALYSGVESESSFGIKEYVLKLERKALQRCMISSLYRKSMLTMINFIKQCTSEQKLCGRLPPDLWAANLQPFTINSSAYEVGPFLTPPADYPSVTKSKCGDVEESVPSIQEHTNFNIQNTKAISTDCCDKSRKSEAPHHLSMDSKSFNSSCGIEPPYDWDEIEKEMARVCGLMFCGSDSDLGDLLMEGISAPHQNPINVNEPAPLERFDWQALRIKHEGELKRRWEELEKNASLEKQAKLKRRIVQLFGEDELVFVEASCDMSDKEAAQYRERIAPWIVKHLMPLYKEKRIVSRIIFKKLARYIADCLILRNCSPDECDVWMAVQEFFPDGKFIRSESDIFM